jgi:hypothetical protein
MSLFAAAVEQEFHPRSMPGVPAEATSAAKTHAEKRRTQDFMSASFTGTAP